MLSPFFREAFFREATETKNEYATLHACKSAYILTGEKRIVNLFLTAKLFHQIATLMQNRPSQPFHEPLNASGF